MRPTPITSPPATAPAGVGLRFLLEHAGRSLHRRSCGRQDGRHWIGRALRNLPQRFRKRYSRPACFRTQVADGAAGSILDGASAGTLLAGNLNVYVSDSSGLFTADELNRIQDAITVWDSLLAPYNVTITEVSDSTLAGVVIDTGSTSAAGTAADGILDSYSSSGEITILQGWSWYGGSDPTQIGSTQYDFQTVVTHELGHALGLGGSQDSTSSMYELLAAGVVRRAPMAADLNIPEAPDGADPERAAPPRVEPLPGPWSSGSASAWLASIQENTATPYASS